MNNHTILRIRLKFYGPYEITDRHISPDSPEDLKNDPEFIRFMDDFHWLRPKETGELRPCLDGTTIRRKTIEHLMEFFCMFNGHDSLASLNICDGWDHKPDNKDYTKATGLEKMLSHNMFRFNQSGECSKETPCTLCTIRGIFDPVSCKAKRKVRFRNVYPEVNFKNIEDLCGPTLKTRNFCRGKKGKSVSFFTIWEGDHKKCSNFVFKIEIDKTIQNDRLKLIKEFLSIGLAGIKYISGAPCRMDIIAPERTEKKWDTSPHSQLITNFIKTTQLNADKIQLKSAGLHVDSPIIIRPVLTTMVADSVKKIKDSLGKRIAPEKLKIFERLLKVIL